MNTEFSVAAHWPGGFDEVKLRQWAEDLRLQLLAPQVSLGLVFMSPKFFPHARQTLEILRVHARIPLLAGCSSPGLIADSREIENALPFQMALQPGWIVILRDLDLLVAASQWLVRQLSCHLTVP